MDLAIYTKDLKIVIFKICVYTNSISLHLLLFYAKYKSNNRSQDIMCWELLYFRVSNIFYFTLIHLSTNIKWLTHNKPLYLNIVSCLLHHATSDGAT